MMDAPLFLRQVTLAATGAAQDVLLAGGRVRFTSEVPAEARVVNAEGKILLPGLFDMHAHLREPGGEDAETIATGAAAAVRGGFTGLVMMPDTAPPVDNGGLVQSMLDNAAKASPIPMWVAGCVSRRREGLELAEMEDMRARGAVFLTDDPDPVRNPQLLRRALQYARDLGLLVATHGDVKELSAGGAMHDGPVSYRLGLPGIHPCAEEIGIARDIRLAQSCRGRVHIHNVTTAGGVETIRRYKREGVSVTAGVSPHHLLFTQEDIGDYETNFKVMPPLRTHADREALLQGLLDGALDVIATDHTPCTEFEKLKDFSSAPFGMIWLETALPALHEALVAPGKLPWPVLVERFCLAPRRLLGLDVPAVEDGAPANVVLFNPAAPTEISAKTLQSGARNTPFLGRSLAGRVELVALGDRLLLDHL